jgi:ribosome assembly protein YihI (activator of Der GTPase)
MNNTVSIAGAVAIAFVAYKVYVKMSDSPKDDEEAKNLIKEIVNNVKSYVENDNSVHASGSRKSSVSGSHKRARKHKRKGKRGGSGSNRRRSLSSEEDLTSSLEELLSPQNQPFILQAFKGFQDVLPVNSIEPDVKSPVQQPANQPESNKKANSLKDALDKENAFTPHHTQQKQEKVMSAVQCIYLSSYVSSINPLRTRAR